MHHIGRISCKNKMLCIVTETRLAAKHNPNLHSFFSSIELTVSAVELHGVGRQLDGNAAVVGLWKFKILHLAVRAEHIHIQDCRVWGIQETSGRRTIRRTKETVIVHSVFDSDLKS